MQVVKTKFQVWNVKLCEVRGGGGAGGDPVRTPGSYQTSPARPRSLSTTVTCPPCVSPSVFIQSLSEFLCSYFCYSYYIII